MSHVRIFDNPKGKWFRAGQQPPLTLTGALADYVPSMAYEGRLQIGNAIGASFAMLTSGTLPPGFAITVDEDTDEVVVTWPAYSSEDGPVAIANPGFESGNTGWDLGASWEIGTWNWEYDGDDNDLQAYDGTKSAELHAGFRGNSRITMATPAPCDPGTTITGSCQVQQGPSVANYTGGWVILQFLDINGAVIETREGNHVVSGNDAEWHLSTVTATAPAGTVYARLGAEGFRRLQNKPMWVDTFAWDLEFDGVELGTNTDADIALCIHLTDSAGRGADWCGTIGAAPPSFDDVLAALNPDWWLRLDESSGATAADAIGALDGTLAGTYTRGAAPLRTGSDHSTTFTAANCSVSSGAALDYAASVPVTFGAIVRPTSLAGGGVRHSIVNNLVNSGLGYTNFALYLVPSGGALYPTMAVTDAGTNTISTASSPDAVALDTAYMILGAFDGTYFDVMVNGVRKTHVNKGALAAPGTAGGTQVGGDATNPGSYKFVGQISDVFRIPGYVTEAQALALAQAAGLA
jgi:hypothetical protein